MLEAQQSKGMEALSSDESRSRERLERESLLGHWNSELFLDPLLQISPSTLH